MEIFSDKRQIEREVTTGIHTTKSEVTIGIRFRKG